MEQKISRQDKCVNALPAVGLVILAIATIVAYFVM